MIALEADHRPTFEKALSDFRNTVFPDYFYTFMSDYVVNLAADHHVPNSDLTNDPIARSYGQADSIISGICRDWDGMIAAMIEEHDLAVSRLSEADQAGLDDRFAGEDLSECFVCHSGLVVAHSIARFLVRCAHSSASQYHHVQHTELRPRIVESQRSRASSSDCETTHCGRDYRPDRTIPGRPVQRR